MLAKNIAYIYYAHDEDIEIGSLARAIISNAEIRIISNYISGYVNFYFPIDSNK